jgi:hypothetical protein
LKEGIGGGGGERRPKDTVKTMITLQITLLSNQYVGKKKNIYFFKSEKKKNIYICKSLKNWIYLFIYLSSQHLVYKHHIKIPKFRGL